MTRRETFPIEPRACRIIPACSGLIPAADLLRATLARCTRGHVAAWSAVLPCGIVRLADRARARNGLAALPRAAPHHAAHESQHETSNMANARAALRVLGYSDALARRAVARVAADPETRTFSAADYTRAAITQAHTL